MLTGRFGYVDPGERRRARTALILALNGGCEIRYADHLRMGRVYLTTPEQLMTLPQLADSGPDVLDRSLTEEAFRQRLLHHRGQIKSILTNHRFIAGIGNAYSDEILWEARLNPYRKRTELSEAEISALYRAIHSVIAWATTIVTEKMQDAIDYAEWRDHLRVHRRGGEACPRCGATISEITASQRVTSFCRQCQPGHAGL
jgi:formamidopyrimidine-DNA glycosylase